MTAMSAAEQVRRSRARRLEADPVGYRAKAAEAQRVFRAKNPGYYRSYYYARKLSEPTWIRTQTLRRYGLTTETHRAMYDSQGGLCAICRVGWAEHIDHDHQTGRVRGLLCENCNLGLGRFADQPESLRAAISYLAATK